MSLWTVLVIVTLSQLVYLAGQRPNLRRAFTAQLWFAFVTSVALAAAWTWHSIELADWRYAAIGWLPLVTGAVSGVVAPAQPTHSTTSHHKD